MYICNIFGITKYSGKQINKKYIASKQIYKKMIASKQINNKTSMHISGTIGPI